MAYNIILGTKSGGDIIDLPTAKSHSKISWDDEDGLLAIYLEAAQSDAENYVDGPIRQRPIEIRYSEWYTIFTLLTTNVISVSSVKYLDPQGAEQTVDPSNYDLLTTPGGHKLHMNLEDFPDLSEDDPFPVRVEMEAGWPDDSIPGAIQAAVLLRFSHLNQFREDMPTSVERSFQGLLRPFKRYWYG